MMNDSYLGTFDYLDPLYEVLLAKVCPDARDPRFPVHRMSSNWVCKLSGVPNIYHFSRSSPACWCKPVFLDRTMIDIGGLICTSTIVNRIVWKISDTDSGIPWTAYSELVRFFIEKTPLIVNRHRFFDASSASDFDPAKYSLSDIY